MTLFEEIKEKGIPYRNHYSDLYIPATAETRAMVARHGHRIGGSATTFTNQVEGGTWIDVPMAFSPYWDSKGGN